MNGEARSTVEYNPMTGTRRDLEVTTEEDGSKSATRWRTKRLAYLRTLLAGDLSAEARAMYQREIARCTE